MYLSTMHEEMCSLTWDTYSDHLKSMMKELMTNEDFSDVTLVTEDKKHIKANINILGTCSPVFKHLLKREKSSNQIMYLRGIQFTEIETIIQFIYLGEATFYKERMDELLAVAKSLEIEVLCSAKAETNEEPYDEPSPRDPGILTEKLGEQTVVSDYRNKQTLQNKEISALSEEKKYECEQCHKIYSRLKSLYQHEKSAHLGVIYACNQCDYQATRQGNLTAHIQSKHEGITHACNQCDYLATKPGNLTRHIQSIHEGIKYACDKCDYQASTQTNLSVHIQSKHDGIRYACNQCDYQATVQQSLPRHTKLVHSNL